MFSSLFLANGPILTNWIAKFIDQLFQATGNFGWAVIVFTIVLKVALSPLDIWQRFAQQKQSVAMQKIQPQLNKLKVQYKDRPDLLRQEQQKLFKSEKVSMFSSILPMIITMVIFFIVFAGFNEMVRYQNEKIVYNLYESYLKNPSIDAASLASQYNASLEAFKFGWIKNVFSPDSWANSVPDFKHYAGSGLGAINASSSGVNLPNYYNVLVGPAFDATKKTNFFDFKHWNGYLILPILSIILSLVSAKFLTPNQPTSFAADDASQKTQNTTAKFMKYLMPLLIGVFALFYSAAFSLYIFVSTLFSILLTGSMTLIFKTKEKKNNNYVVNNKKGK